MRCRMLFGVRLSSEQPRSITGAAYIADWSAELCFVKTAASHRRAKEERRAADCQLSKAFSLSFVANGRDPTRPPLLSGSTCWVEEARRGNRECTRLTL
jgi:hypothetical protein